MSGIGETETDPFSDTRRQGIAGKGLTGAVAILTCSFLRQEEPVVGRAPDWLHPRLDPPCRRMGRGGEVN